MDEFTVKKARPTPLTDLEQLRRETERLQAEAIHAIAKDQLYRLQRSWRREMWDELKIPLLIVGVIFFVIAPLAVLFVFGVATLSR